MIEQLDYSPLAHEIVKNYILSRFEPNPISLPLSNEGDLLKAKRGISIADGNRGARFGTPVKRSSFLGACLDFTAEESIEHLIVGYGLKHGNTTKIKTLHHVIGDTHSVAPTPTIARAIQYQIFQVPRGEVLIFHNHPKWFLNILMDNLPLASSPDRTIALHLKFNWFQFLKSFFGNGDVKLYVGENNCVKEFSFPPIDYLVELYRKYTATSNSYSAVAY